MKILMSILLVLGSFAYAAIVDTNMDKKVYYDADRTEQDKLQVMSKELELFINDEADESLISEYKNGEVEATSEEIELEKEALENIPNEKSDVKAIQTNTKDKAEDKQPGFFARMLEKIGIGSTKTIQPADEAADTTVSKEVQPPQEEQAQEEVQKKEVVENAQ